MKTRKVVTITVAALLISSATRLSSFAQFQSESESGQTKSEYKKHRDALLEQRQALELQREALNQQWQMLEQQKQSARLAEEKAMMAGRLGFGRSDLVVNRLSDGINMKIHQATEAIRNAKSDEARADATNRLREMLDQYFEQDMKARTKELEGIAARLEKLQAQLDRRRQKKQEIIDLQVRVALNEADGLGFYSQLKDATYFDLVVPTTNVWAPSGDTLMPAPPAIPPVPSAPDPR